MMYLDLKIFISSRLLYQDCDTSTAECAEPWTLCAFKLPFINALGIWLRQETAGAILREGKLAN